ncbi:unnamed protein product [Lactuca virosa]|uniref:Vacuolar membrane protease n=1 Tax=Lactuca virosa TaxID=75947 RepID=A0AAU9P1L1_9ASTR|nr:unnamed protein product [Lactuca virosa]
MGVLPATLATLAHLIYQRSRLISLHRRAWANLTSTETATDAQAIRLIVKADTYPLKRPFTHPSILFDAKEAADIDLDTLFNLALSDGQAAKDEMQGVIVYDYELNIGWGKSVSLTSQSLPAPPPGQMAIRSKEGATVILSGPSGPPLTSVPSQNSELVIIPNVPDDKGLTGSSSDLRYDYGKLYALDGATHATCEVLAAYLLNNLRFVFFTRAYGSESQHPWSCSIHMAIDLEAMGDGGASAIFQAGPNPWAIENYALVAKYPSGQILAQDLFTLGVIQSATDFQVYKEVAGLSGIDFAYPDNTAVYHRKNDKLKLLKPGSLQHLGENMLAFLLHSASSSQLTKMASNDRNQHDPAIYFDILRSILMYHLTSPDGTVSFQFQHNVCGRSIYAEGAIDAALFLAKKPLLIQCRLFNEGFAVKGTLLVNERVKFMIFLATLMP